MNAAEKIREMSEDEFRDKFAELLLLVRDNYDGAHVGLSVEEGDLQTAWGTSKFNDADIELGYDPFMSYDGLRRRLVQRTEVEQA